MRVLKFKCVFKALHLIIYLYNIKMLAQLKQIANCLAWIRDRTRVQRNKSTGPLRLRTYIRIIIGNFKAQIET